MVKHGHIGAIKSFITTAFGLWHSLILIHIGWGGYVLCYAEVLRPFVIYIMLLSSG